MDVKLGPTILDVCGEGFIAAAEFMSLVGTGPYDVLWDANAPAKLTSRVAKKLARRIIDDLTVLAEWTERSMYRVVYPRTRVRVRDVPTRVHRREGRLLERSSPILSAEDELFIEYRRCSDPS